MTTRASAGAAPRSRPTKRRTLAYRAAQPGTATGSCQIAIALRPWPSASAISSRYGSHALALGARVGGDGGVGSVDTSGVVAGFEGPRSVDTPDVVAGFGGPTPGRPARPRTGLLPALRQ